MRNKSNSLSQLALQRFKKNFWGVFSAFFILFCGLCATFAYILAPDSSENANQMHLSIHSKPPGFEVSVLSIPNSSEIKKSFLSRIFSGKENPDIEIPISTYSFKDNIIQIVPYNEENENVLSRDIELRHFPSNLTNAEIEDEFIQKKTFLLGTDKYGRDLLSRMLIGMRISLSIGFIAVFISLLIGISLGSLAGYYGGKIDALIMWLINVTWTIPTLLLVIAITLALGKGFWQVFLAVGLTMWVEVARVVRGQILGLKQKQYVTAARALGFSNRKIIINHMLPNIMAPVIVISAANFASAILIESGLSFLGIGAQPPVPSWGAMIKDHYSYIILGKAYLAIIPGVAIMSLVMAFMLIGNSLRDALDVRS
ncbi:MAG TPA: ABC transporter permease [Salinimicrobium sp.]|nr:ABC transporter permease [Salinimicrobium sp.]